MHFANRSPDPVTGVSVHFLINTEAGGAKESEVPIISFSYLAPCSEVTINKSDLKKWYTKGEIPRGEKTHIGVMALVFTDSNGKEWARTPWSLDNDTDKSNLPGITKLKPLGTKPLDDLRSISQC